MWLLSHHDLPIRDTLENLVEQRRRLMIRSTELNSEYDIKYKKMIKHKEENLVIDEYNSAIYLRASHEELMNIRNRNINNEEIISTFEAMRDEIVYLNRIIDRINTELRRVNNLITSQTVVSPAVSTNIDSYNSIESNSNKIKSIEELNTSIDGKYSADPRKILEFSELMKELYKKRDDKIITCEFISKWACENNFDQEFIHLLILQSARYFANFLLGGKSNDPINKALTQQENDIIKEWMNKEKFGGMAVEREHMGVPYHFMTGKIAMDHFAEEELYYKYLQDMEL